ncbi:DUF2950 family protein [Planctomycetota bacterium]
MKKGFTLIELMIVIAIIAIIAAIAIPSLIKSKIAANEGAASGSMKTFNGMFATFKKKKYCGSFLYPIGVGGEGTREAAVTLNAGKYAGVYYDVNNAGDRIGLIGAAEAAADIRGRSVDLVALGTTGQYGTQVDTLASYVPVIFATTWLPQLPGVTFRIQDKQGYWFAMMRQLATTGGNFSYNLAMARNRYGLCAFPSDYGASGESTFLMNEEGTVYQMDTGEGDYVDIYPGTDPTKDNWSIAK